MPQSRIPYAGSCFRCVKSSIPYAAMRNQSRNSVDVVVCKSISSPLNFVYDVLRCSKSGCVMKPSSENRSLGREAAWRNTAKCSRPVRLQVHIVLVWRRTERAERTVEDWGTKMLVCGSVHFHDLLLVLCKAFFFVILFILVIVEQALGCRYLIAASFVSF